tara:strand:- start:59 stop:358 length:300 start_codon:yes stop_codon:yes gene_type:complete
MSKKMSLNLGGHQYKILVQELEAIEASKVLYGQHLVEHNIILINENIDQSRKEETLIHEVLHAIHYNTGLEHSERTIEAISNGLFQLGIGEYLWKKAQK